MIKMNKLYRATYISEDIVVERNYTDGIWHDTTELVPNAVVNSQISNQAIVIGNGISRLDFNLLYIKNHTGGLYGSRALQTYGCNALYRDFNPDFLIATGNEIIKEISDSGYTENNIVYTDADSLLRYPDKFYLIPYNSYVDAGTTAAYIAAFDGHKKVYLIGFDGHHSINFNNNVYADTYGYQSKTSNVIDDSWIYAQSMLFSTYNDTEFVQVTQNGKVTNDSLWTHCTNFRQVSFRDFALEVDL